MLQVEQPDSGCQQVKGNLSPATKASEWEDKYQLSGENHPRWEGNREGR